MKILLGAFALTIAIPAAAQTGQPATDPHAGHSQPADHSQHKGGETDHSQHGEKHQNCCEHKSPDGKMMECCEKAKADGSKMDCCDKDAAKKSGEAAHQH